MTSKNTTRMLLIAGAALVSCSENALEQDMSKSNVEIIATIDNEGLTRSCIDPTVYKDNVTGLLWSSGDLLGVYGFNCTNNAKFENTSTAKAANATFIGKLADGETPQYCYYPYTEANNGKAYDALTGKVNAVQSYSADGLLSDDWKYSTSSTAEGGAYRFKMKSLFALAKVVVDATGSAVEGESLKSVSIKATSGSEVRAINGAFTFSAADGSYSLTKAEAESTTIAWTDEAVLSSVKKHTGYITLIPEIKAEDKITITVTTDKHTAVFEVPCLKSLASGYIYDFPMTLTDLATKMNEAGYGEPKYSEIGGTTPDPEPVVTTGTFTASAFNVDGLPDLSYIVGSINPDGPGKDGTSTMAGIANNLGWDIIAASEDFEYDSQLVAGLSNYSHGTWRGSVSSKQLTS
ncbi:MAG: fimbrillin family protein, partial [Bacteroidales bacterium]|nr:fimbrillin family protein [Bacteroidales bacterium]